MQIMRTAIAQLIDLTKSARSHKRHIDSHIQSHQRLVRTYVAGSLLTTDMLLAGLECKHICTLTVHIAGSAHDTSRKLAHMVLAASKETYVRAAVAERNAERLRISADDVRIPFARSPDDSQRRRIGIDHQETLLCMHCISKTGQVLYYTIFIDARNKNSGNVSCSKLSQHRSI